jgi:hypothetical protein
MAGKEKKKKREERTNTGFDEMKGKKDFNV